MKKAIYLGVLFLMVFLYIFLPNIDDQLGKASFYTKAKQDTAREKRPECEGLSQTDHDT